MITLAWRNIWRNKRRTFITLSAIVFAVFFAIAMRSLQLGTYSNMINNVVSFYSGYAQIHANGFWDDKSLDNGFMYNESMRNALKLEEGRAGFIPRLESFALASAGKVTRGCMVVGTDPLIENSLIKLSEKLTEGKLPETGNSEILVSEGLAEYLHIQTGDTLVLLGQGYHGQSAAGKYPVCGVVKFGSPKLNDGLVYLPLEAAQYLTGAEGILTSLVIMPKDPEDLSSLIASISSSLGEDFEVMTWEEMMPEVVQAIQADSSAGILMLIILYLVIGFGLFGTILMMTAERTHEFGILMAIGMRKERLSGMLAMETLLLSLTGAIIGVVISLPVTIMGNIHPLEFTGEAAKGMERMGVEPIIPFSLDPSIYLNQGLIVLIIALVLSVYPIYALYQLKVVKAMK